MSPFFKRKEHEPTMEESAGCEVRANVGAHEMIENDMPPPTEYATRDEDLIAEVLSDPELKPWLPLYSHLNRLTNLDKKQVELFTLRVEGILSTTEIEMSAEDYSAGKWAKFQAHATFLKNAIYDSHQGFKLQKLTTVRKELTWQPKEEKKKSWF